MTNISKARKSTTSAAILNQIAMEGCSIASDCHAVRIEPDIRLSDVLPLLSLSGLIGEYSRSV